MLVYYNHMLIKKDKEKNIKGKIELNNYNKIFKHSAGISQMNDLGQFLGGFTLGVISDKLQKR